MTNKITNELHSTHAKRLEVIINPQSQFAPFLKRNEFSTILKIELNTLSAIEKILPESKLEEKYTSASLVKTFNEITKEEFKLDKDFKYDDEGDLIDNINYLPKYCLNIFKANIDDLIEGKKVSVEQPNINFKSHEPEDVGMDAANAFNMGAMGFGGMSNYENPLLAGKAYARLREDFNKGTVYQFKTKPKIIPIIKWVLLFLVILAISASIITAVAAFMLNGAKYMYDGKEYNLSTITAGMFYIILAGFEIYILITTILNIHKGCNKKHKNENYLYSFNWPLYLTIVILGILIFLLDINGLWVNAPNFKELSSTQQTAFNLWKWMIIVGPCISGLIIIPMVIGALKAPKPDMEKIEQILHKYIDEMVGTPSTPSEGVDVQKPVDVKPSNDKPSEEQAA